ncbi:hypothetical protein WA588_001695, partial [Blastocystis sp. NMH]
MSITIQPFSVSNKGKKDHETPSLFKQPETDSHNDDCAEEICEQGVQAAESGDMGKALSLLSHAVVLNDKDYKTYEMIAQIHLLQDRPFGAVKYALKSVALKPDWCEGYITLARAQREMGEVDLSLDSYKKAISLLDTAASLNEKEKEEVRQECKELTQIYNHYKEEHGELQGRAHVVKDMSEVEALCGDFSSMRETWKEEIKNSILEMQERQEEEQQQQSGMEE